MDQLREKAPHSYFLLELSVESSLQNILDVADCRPSPLRLANKVWMEGAVQTVSRAGLLADQIVYPGIPGCFGEQE